MRQAPRVFNLLLLRARYVFVSVRQPILRHVCLNVRGCTRRTNNRLPCGRLPSAVSLDDEATLAFVAESATDYFSKLVWVIGNMSIDMNVCLRTEADHKNTGRLEYFIAEHLDHFHYMNDVLMLDVKLLNERLIQQLVNSLLVPLYVFCLCGSMPDGSEEARRIDPLLAIYLLAHVFLIFDHSDMINTLAASILNGEPDYVIAESKDAADTAAHAAVTTADTSSDTAATETPPNPTTTTPPNSTDETTTLPTSPTPTVRAL